MSELIAYRRIPGDNDYPSTLGPNHWLSRDIPGSITPLPLPLCWDAEGKRTGATDEEWWLSVDHGAIEPESLWFAATKAHVTCRDCIEWLRA